MRRTAGVKYAELHGGGKVFITITVRPWRDETDLPLIVDLLRSIPSTSRHLIDIPWRLSSPALHTGRDACVWEMPMEG